MLVDLANTPAQIQAIVDAITPYTPALLLDQFGNYVVQCCLRFDNNRNQFIFDAIAAKIIEIGTGRFGARSTRTCLESQFTTKRQQKIVATAIVQHGAQLSVDSNGSLLITWLLDTSTLPGKVGALVPAYSEHIVTFCTHKLASGFILKILNQRTELEARESLLKDIFFNQNPTVLAQILSDAVNGVTLIRKILSSACTSTEEQVRLAEQARQAVNSAPDLKTSAGCKRLMEEVSTLSQSSPKSVEHRDDEIVSPMTPRAMGFHPSPATPPLQSPQGH